MPRRTPNAAAAAIAAAAVLAAAAPALIAACDLASSGNSSTDATILDAAVSGNSSHGIDCGSHGDNAHARRVTLKMIPVLWLVWGTLMVLIFFGYGKLRDGFRTGYIELQQAGKIHDEIEPSSPKSPIGSQMNPFNDGAQPGSPVNRLSDDGDVVPQSYHSRADSTPRQTSPSGLPAEMAAADEAAGNPAWSPEKRPNGSESPAVPARPGLMTVSADCTEVQEPSDLGDKKQLENATWFAKNFGFLDTTIAEISDERGLDASMYLTHLKDCGHFCIFLFATMGIWLLFLYRFGGSDNEKDAKEAAEEPNNWALYAFSYGNLGNSKTLWWSVLGAAWQVVSSIGFAVYRQKVMKKLKKASKGQDFHSKQHMWLKNIPRHFREGEIKTWFDQKFPGQVDYVRVALDVHHLGRNIRERRKLITRINKTVVKLKEDVEVNEAAGTVFKESKREKRLRKIEKNKKKLQELVKEEPAIRSMEVRGSGSVLVAFRTVADAKAFRRALWKHQLDNEGLGCEKWRAIWAPLPAEIYWENLGLDTSEALRSKAWALGLTYATFSFFLAWVAVAVYFIGRDYMYIMYHLDVTDHYERNFKAVRDSVTPFIFYPVICLAMFVGILGMEENMSPITKYFSKFERPSTKSKKQSSYMAKTYFFYLIYHVIMTTAGLAILSLFMVKCDNKVMLFVETIGAFHMNRTFLTCCIIDPFHCFEGVKFFSRKSRVLTIEERAAFTSAEDEEDDDEERVDEEEDPHFSDHFDYTKNYAESLALFSSMSYYAIMHPTILPCAAVYFYTKYAIDKYQITQQYTRARIQFSRRARTTTKFVLFSSMFGQLGNVIFFGLLRPDSAGVASGFMLVFFFSALFYFVYTYKRRWFRKWLGLHKKEKKGAAGEGDGEAPADRDVFDPMAVSKTSYVDEDDDSDEEEEVDDDSFELVYQPPNPDTMDVGIVMLDLDGDSKEPNRRPPAPAGQAEANVQISIGISSPGSENITTVGNPVAAATAEVAAFEVERGGSVGSGRPGSPTGANSYSSFVDDDINDGCSPSSTPAAGAGPVDVFGGPADLRLSDEQVDMI